MGDFVRGDQGEVLMRALRMSVGLIPAVFLAVTVVTATSAEAQNPATFTSDIRPIMERSCWNCHGEEFQRSGLDLRTRSGALLGGSNGPAIVPGRAEESLLYRGGQVIGATDDFGYKALEQPISAHDLHATMLHLLGMDHTRLTYRFSGRDMRLTDVAGTLIPQIVG